MQNKNKQQNFCKKVKGKGYEVFGVVNPDKSILLEDRVMLDHKRFLDVYIPFRHVLIEQKSIDIDLEDYYYRLSL